MKQEKLPGESDIRQKLMLKLMTSPWTLIPFLFGVTDLLTLWTFSIESGAGYFAGIAAILGSVGILLTRMITGSETVSRELIKDLEKDVQMKRERALDELDKKLADDGDPRTEGCLRDLRKLTGMFQKEQKWNHHVDTKTTFDIISGVEKMFRQCVISLEKTLDLWNTARHMTTPEARNPILKERERLVVDVKASIKQLGCIMAEIQVLKSGDQSGDSDLARIREELNQSLAVARTVETRMQTLEKEINQKGGLDNV